MATPTIKLAVCLDCVLLLAGLSLVSSCSPAAQPTGGQPNAFAAVFPAATRTVEVPLSDALRAESGLSRVTVLEIRSPAGLLGYWVESEVTGRSGPFTIRVLLDTDLTIRQSSVLFYPWARGRGVRTAGFTGQFEGKSLADPIRVGGDIAAVTGATVSCEAMARGVRQSIRLIHRLTEK